MNRVTAMVSRRRGESESGPGAADGVTAGRGRRGDAGATLILALLFMLVIGTIVAGIASWTANGLSSTLTFQKASDVQTALQGATNVAIQSIRYTPLVGTTAANPETLNANPPSFCFGSGPGSSVPTPVGNVDVWCSTVWNPASANTRVVTVSACLNTSDAGNAATCAGNTGLQTIVTFDDYSAQSPNISLAPCTAPPAGTCGTGMTISSSLIRASSPTVTGVSNTTTHLSNGPVTGGGTLQVNGAGFEAGSTWVNFVGASVTQNLVLNGTNVTVTSPASLTVTIPPATTTGTYNVVVTTPSGTSASSSASQYIYNPVIPTVISVTTASGSATGSAAGGSTVIVNGTGFLSNLITGNTTSVQFIDPLNAANTYTAPTFSITVNSTGTQLTATTPAISSTDLTYNVVVVTSPGGTSLAGASGTTFAYQPLLPLVASVFATSGAGGASVTVTGVGFISGNTTVQLVSTGNSPTLTLTAVTLTGSTSLTATVPSGGKVNGTYDVVVTTPSGSSGTNSAPVFTYT